MEMSCFEPLLEAAELLKDAQTHDALLQMRSVYQEKQYFVAFIGQYSAGAVENIAKGARVGVDAINNARQNGGSGRAGKGACGIRRTAKRARGGSRFGAAPCECFIRGDQQCLFPIISISDFFRTG